MFERVLLGVTKLRRALAARYLFDNWYTLLIRDAMARLGFNTELTARVSDCTIELSIETFEILVSRFSRGLIKPLRCVDGELYINNSRVPSRISRINEFHALSSGWIYDDNFNCWVKGDTKFKRMYLSILEVFDYGVYDALDVRDRVVVDVGAFVGDSAIYFALRGAKKVIAIEPHPGAYAEMLENIRINNLESVIVPVNAGLAGRSGKIRVEDVDEERTSVTFHKLSDMGSVEAVTLDEIVDRFSIHGGAVLKMDCEGCEYEVLPLTKPETLNVFDQVLIEYHSGYRTLRDILESYGFSTSIKPAGSNVPVSKQGYIVASHRTQESHM